MASSRISFAKFDHLNRCRTCMYLYKDIFLYFAQKKNWRLTFIEMFVVSQAIRRHENDLKLPDIISRCLKEFRKYIYSPIHEI